MAHSHSTTVLALSTGIEAKNEHPHPGNYFPLIALCYPASIKSFKTTNRTPLNILSLLNLLALLLILHAQTVTLPNLLANKLAINQSINQSI
jgi:hypothetical protein